LQAIELLYPRLAPGGFLIVDDWGDWKTCRAAIYQYRARA
jgi:O-methyltransferase